MDCIVRVIKGPDQGATAKLAPGANLIGRSPKAVLRLTGQDISLEHIVINRSGDDYTAENLSANGTLIEDQKMAGQVRLRPRNVMKLSKETTIRFESASGAEGSIFADRRTLVMVLVLMLGLGALVVFIKPLTGDKPANWPYAYEALRNWIDREARAKRLPEASIRLFREADRLEKFENFDSAKVIWLQLQLLLELENPKRHFNQLSIDNPMALTNLTHPTPTTNLSDDEMAAALVQYVRSHLTWTAKNSKSSSGIR